MSLRRLSIGFAGSVLAFALLCCLGCSDNSEEPAGTSGNANLTVTSFSDCKSGLSKLAGVSATEECIEWQYSEGKLSIHHINAGFNCCVSALLASFDKEANVITITEKEAYDQGGCNCLCLYDLDYEISYLAAGEYTFTISGPYMETGSTPESDDISFTIDLTEKLSGSYCVERDHYPWE